MRIRKTVKIDDHEYVVRELTVREIINLFQEASDGAVKTGGKADDAGVEFFKSEFGRFLQLALEGQHELDEFINMPPSDIDKLYTTFKEVNEVFFRIARSAGMDKILDELKTSILRDFSSLLVGSSKPDTLRRLVMDTPTSLPQ